MSNRNEDIGVRIHTDYADALKQVQQFTGLAGKEFAVLPKLVEAVSKSVDGLASQLNRLGATRGPQELQNDFTKLPPVIQQLAGSVDALTQKIDKLGTGSGVPDLNRKLRESNREATLLEKTFDRIKTGGKLAFSAMAGYQAGKAVVAPAVHETMDYSMRMAQAVNTGYLGASIDEKRVGMTKMQQGVMDAVRFGGGTREQALEAVEKLIARGSIGDVDKTLKTLPFLVQVSTAGNAKSTDTADMVSGFVQQMKIPIEQLPKALGMALYGGAVGGFEMRHMAQYLPQQGAAAKNVGIGGLKGVATLVALNEMAINSAGSAEQAGINVTDFLNSLSSAHMANNLKRFAVDRRTGTLVEKHGRSMKDSNYIDLGHQLAHNQEQGIDAVDSMVQIVRMVAEGDPKFLEAKQKQAAAKERLEAAKRRGDKGGEVAAAEEMNAIAESVTQILMGRGIGKLFHNQQELRGGIGAVLDPESYRQMKDQVMEHGNEKTIKNEHEFIASQAGYKLQMAEQERAEALQNAMGGVNSALGKYADKTTELYQKYPSLAAAMEGGKVAVNGIAAASGAASLVMLMLSKNGAAAATALGGVAASGGGKNLTGGPYGAGMGKFGTAMNLLGSFGVGYTIGDMIVNPALDWASKKLSGGKSASLGGYIYDLTHSDPAEPARKAEEGQRPQASTVPVVRLPSPIQPTPAVMFPLSEQAVSGMDSGALQRQIATPGIAAETMQKQLLDGIKPLPLDARLKVDVAFTESGKPYVANQRIDSGNIRLDTGPMMTH